MPFFEILAPGARADGAAMMGRGAKRPLDVHAFRLDVQRKDGTAVTVEVHASPLWEDGAVVGRVGVGQLVHREDASADVDAIERAVLEERERIAHALRDRITELFGETADRAAPA